MTATTREPGYFFPCLFVLPPDEDVEAPPYRLIRRQWQTSTFDLATLATRHKLHLPYQTMDVFLSSCSVELSVTPQESLAEAVALVDILRLCLCASGLSPFIVPFVSSHSVNEYSGINSRDAGSLSESLPAGLRLGLTSNSGTVEVWPLQLSFSCIAIQDELQLTKEIFLAAVAKAREWRRLAAEDPILPVLQDASNLAPTLPSLDQSLLHLWTGLEALFPRVNAELAFKIAVYLAQLAGTERDRLAYFNRVRRAYTTRSNVAHGTKRGVPFEEWRETWRITMDSVNSIVTRGGMPSEEALLTALLGPGNLDGDA